MFGAYGDVLRTPGARAFSVAGLIARLPMSMFGLGILLAVTESGGTYTLGGLTAGIALAAQAAAAPVQARIADRQGQHRLLVPLLAAHTVGLALLIAVVGDAAVGALPYAMLAASTALTGITFPQIGALVRARWASLYTATSRLHTAYAWESVLDEVVYILGPTIVVLLSTSFHPLAGLVAMLLLTVGGGYTFATLRATEPPVRHTTDGRARERLPVVTLGWLVVAFVFMGGIFGSAEVATVAFAEELGSKAASGPALAVFAAGSLIAGLVAGAMHWKAGLRRRFLVGQAALAAAVLPLALVGSIPLLLVAIFVAGFAIAPTLITGFSMVEAEVPASRLTEGLAWVSTALTVGVAVGAAVAGPVIDRVGASEGYLVGFGCGILATLACLVGVAADRPARDVPEPA
ncbi:MAG TPA: MFS transporter [Jiangellaceae bacterium]